MQAASKDTPSGQQGGPAPAPTAEPTPGLGASSGRVAVVTGAGSGIGRAVARAFLAAGWEVVLAGRRPEALMEAADGAPGARIVPMDVTDPEDVASGFARVEQETGRIDGSPDTSVGDLSVPK